MKKYSLLVVCLLISSVLLSACNTMPDSPIKYERKLGKYFDSEKKSFNYFDVTYEHEILPEDTVLVYCENTEMGKKFTGLLKENATPCFSVEIKY